MDGVLFTRVDLRGLAGVSPHSLAGPRWQRLGRDNARSFAINPSGVSFSDEGDFGKRRFNASLEDREGNLGLEVRGWPAIQTAHL